AEYLARAGAIGHDEAPGDPGFSGATVRDRLAAQGYPEAMASEVAASSDSGTEDVRFLWDLPYHRLGLMHPHAVVAGWGHAEIGGHDVAVLIVPQIYERDYVAIVPVAPLSAGTKYRVRLALTVAGTDVLDEWEFETEP